ncbi:MAG: sulfurtransferase [Thermoplasmatales archaeon]|nr:MAG: sulfurtransferase [Thermoplasmatales archaeon]
MLKNKLQQLTSISTEELFGKIEEPDLKLIDVRSIEAYNGWKLKNEIRGGHIKCARSVPFKWLNYIDWIEIVRAKGIMPSHSLVVYGYDKGETEKVANQFIKAGYKDVRVYYNFIDEWNHNKNLPMERLERYNKLVSANWLNELIKTGNTPEYNNKKYVIFHAYYQNRDAYEEGHIPEAIDLDTNLLESSETWNRRSSKELKIALEQLGITYDTTVILYGRFSYLDNNDPFPGSSAGHLGAFRCAFIMMYAGVKDVRILNGGLQSWIDAGFKTTTREYKKHPVKDFGVSIPSFPKIVVDIEEAKEILKTSDKNLVSVRSWREFIGEVSGYNYIEKKGRIPGAVFGNCGSDAYHMENYRNLDHTTRDYHEIEKMWAEVGITSDKHNSFYCGTGWRGSEAFFNAWLMGWSRISVFDGGWFEWSNEGNPYETGIPKNK